MNFEEVSILMFIVLFIVMSGLLFAFYLIKQELVKANSKNNESLKLRLGAYERLTLYTERASLKNLVARSSSNDLNVVGLQLTLLETLKSEYEYNVSQQIYVSPELWSAIGNLKDQNSYIINQIAASLTSDAPAFTLNKALLEYSMNNNAELHSIVLNALQFEAKKIM
jgi:hypothetical protein